VLATGAGATGCGDMGVAATTVTQHCSDYSNRLIATLSTLAPPHVPHSSL